MGMQFLKNFLLKTADVAPIAPSPGLPSEWTEFIGRICVVASQGREEQRVVQISFIPAKMRGSLRASLTASGRASSIGLLRQPPTK